jgi:hypothetical protein
VSRSASGPGQHDDLQAAMLFLDVRHKAAR